MQDGDAATWGKVLHDAVYTDKLYLMELEANHLVWLVVIVYRY